MNRNLTWLSVFTTAGLFCLTGCSAPSEDEATAQAQSAICDDLPDSEGPDECDWCIGDEAAAQKKKDRLALRAAYGCETNQVVGGGGAAGPGRRYFRSTAEEHDVVETQYQLNSDSEATLNYLCEKAKGYADAQCVASSYYGFSGFVSGGFANRRSCSAGGDFQTCKCEWQSQCDYLWR